MRPFEITTIAVATREALKEALPLRLRLMIGRMIHRSRSLPYRLASGNRYSCNLCGFSGGRFMSAGVPHPALQRKQVVGGGVRHNAVCPRCFSTDRERLVALVLAQLRLVATETRVLHVAPERQLYAHLRHARPAALLAGDLEPKRYAFVDGLLSLDITSLQFDSGSVDLVICNHVLEHVVNDSSALAEVFRILSPCGTAILQVPFSTAITSTEEDAAVTAPAERLSRYGQADHVRLYSRDDYVRRLESVGFHVDLIDPKTLRDSARYALNPLEVVFLARKSPMSTYPSSNRRSKPS